MKTNEIDNGSGWQIKDDSFDEYLKSESISSSDLKNFLECPALFVAGREKKDNTSSKAQELGTAIHDVILCNGEHTAFAADLDLRRKADKERYAELQMSFRSILRGEDAKKVQELARAVRNDSPDFMDLVAESEPERSFYATCPVTGLNIKARPDMVNRPKKAKIDLKTTKDPIKFINEVYRYKYYIQDAFHSYVMELCGYNVEISGWFAVGNSAPYLQRLVLIDRETQKELREHVINGLKELKKALDSADKEKIFSTRLPLQNFIFTEHI